MSDAPAFVSKPLTPAEKADLDEWRRNLSPEDRQRAMDILDHIRDTPDNDGK